MSTNPMGHQQLVHLQNELGHVRLQIEETRQHYNDPFLDPRFYPGLYSQLTILEQVKTNLEEKIAQLSASLLNNAQQLSQNHPSPNLTFSAAPLTYAHPLVPPGFTPPPGYPTPHPAPQSSVLLTPPMTPARTHRQTNTPNLQRGTKPPCHRKQGKRWDGVAQDSISDLPPGTDKELMISNTLLKDAHRKIEAIKEDLSSFTHSDDNDPIVSRLISLLAQYNSYIENVRGGIIGKCKRLREMELKKIASSETTTFDDRQEINALLRELNYVNSEITRLNLRHSINDGFAPVEEVQLEELKITKGKLETRLQREGYKAPSFDQHPKAPSSPGSSTSSENGASQRFLPPQQREIQRISDWTAWYKSLKNHSENPEAMKAHFVRELSASSLNLNPTSDEAEFDLKLCDRTKKAKLSATLLDPSDPAFDFKETLSPPESDDTTDRCSDTSSLDRSPPLVTKAHGSPRAATSNDDDSTTPTPDDA